MRYFFDLTNGHGLVSDNEGQLIEERSRIEQEVSRILTDVARDELPDIQHGEVRVDVRDETGSYVYTGRISFEKRWIDQ